MNNWICILQRKPPEGQGVLLALNTGVITVGYRKMKLGGKSHNWQIFGDLNNLGLQPYDYVTHWMPLPEPPDFKLNGRSEDLYLYP